MEFVGRQHPSYSQNRGRDSQAGVDADLLVAHPEQVALRLHLCVLGTRAPLAAGPSSLLWASPATRPSRQRPPSDVTPALLDPFASQPRTGHVHVP